MISSISASNSFFKCSRFYDHHVTADSCNHSLLPAGNVGRKLSENEMSDTADILLLVNAELQHETFFCFSAYLSIENKYLP